MGRHLLPGKATSVPATFTETGHMDPSKDEESQSETAYLLLVKELDNAIKDLKNETIEVEKALQLSRAEVKQQKKIMHSREMDYKMQIEQLHKDLNIAQEKAAAAVAETEATKKELWEIQKEHSESIRNVLRDAANLMKEMREMKSSTQPVVKTRELKSSAQPSLQNQKGRRSRMWLIISILAMVIFLLKRVRYNLYAESYLFHQSENLSMITLNEMEEYLRPHLLDLSMRCKLWKELGIGLIQSFESSATKLIASSGHSASSLMKKADESFQGIRNETIWREALETSYKRAQVAVGDLNTALKLNLKNLNHSLVLLLEDLVIKDVSDQMYSFIFDKIYLNVEPSSEGSSAEESSLSTNSDAITFDIEIKTEVNEEQIPIQPILTSLTENQPSTVDVQEGKNHGSSPIIEDLQDDQDTQQVEKDASFEDQDQEKVDVDNLNDERLVDNLREETLLVDEKGEVDDQLFDRNIGVNRTGIEHVVEEFVDILEANKSVLENVVDDFAGDGYVDDNLSLNMAEENNIEKALPIEDISAKKRKNFVVNIFKRGNQRKENNDVGVKQDIETINGEKEKGQERKPTKKRWWKP